MTAGCGLLVVISGPSGVGKGAVVRGLLDVLDDARLSVSVTTRPPRPGEQDGVDYLFVSEAEFDRFEADGALLESAVYAGHRYGTPRAWVTDRMAESATVLLEIDVQGALQVRRQIPDALLVFLDPPSVAELERRMDHRGTKDAASRRVRLAAARRELAQRHQFDRVVVNDDLDRCVRAVAAAVRGARRACG